MSWSPKIGDSLEIHLNEAFRLREQNRMVRPGERVTVATVRISKSKTLVNRHEDPYIQYELGFAECCADCREGLFHHTFYQPERTFVMEGEQRKDGRQPSSSSPSRGIRAWKILEMLESITSLWNEGDRDEKCCLHFGEYKFHRVTGENGKTLFCTHYAGEKEYKEAFDTSKDGEDRELKDGLPNVVPGWRLYEFLAWWRDNSLKIPLLKTEQDKLTKLAIKLGMDGE